MSGAKPIDMLMYKDFSIRLGEICIKYYLKPPKIYITNATQANVFVTGRWPMTSSIVVNKSLFNILTKEEMAAVLAHELAHIKNGDILISSISAVLASIILFPANSRLKDNNREEELDLGERLAKPILDVLLYCAVIIIKFGVSGSREIGADTRGAKVMKSGTYMANALSKIYDSTKNSPMYLNPALCSLYICDPYGGQRNKIFELFSTQPAIDERIKRLEKI